MYLIRYNLLCEYLETKEKVNMKDKIKKNKFINEFKEFIMRGNVMDMAVGVIIGGAFTAIVTSLNEDILMPIIGIFGGKDFSYLTFKFGIGDEAAVLRYGEFITEVINFLIIALVVFIMVKAMNLINDRITPKKEEAEVDPTTKKCPYCMSEIAIEATRCAHCTSQLD
jgi:large conductance mechanosensitive channel